MTGRSLAAGCVCGFGIGIFLGVFSGHAYGGDEAAALLPRYKLEVGQQIQYEGSGEFKYTDGSWRDDDLWQITVVGKNPDGSHRLVIRKASTRTRKGTDGSESKQPERISYGMGDMDDSGIITERLGSYGYLLNPTKVLIALPTTAKQKNEGWQSNGAHSDVVLKYRKLPESNDAKLVLGIDEERPENEIYGFEFHDTAIFDTNRGLLENRVSNSKQTYGFNGEGRDELKLVDIQSHDTSWTARFAADAEGYFSAARAFDKATDADDATPESFDQAIANLKSAKEKTETAEFRQKLDNLLEDFQKYRNSTEEDLRNRKALIGQPAEDFKTTDLEDKPRALEDYQGKVVVLDFWYRGCGWCIRAMPELEKVSEHYQGRPVAVLGMNTDQNVEDAKFVIEKLGLNYTTLKAEGLPEKFKVRGFPTLILIDQSGKIRDIYVGWRPTLEQDLEEKIDRLLAETK